MSTKEPLYPYSSLHYSPNFASISSMEGMVPSTFSGYNFDSSYSEMPSGWLLDSNAYWANTLFFVLQTSKPIVLLSLSFLKR